MSSVMPGLFTLSAGILEMSPLGDSLEYNLLFLMWNFNMARRLL